MTDLAALMEAWDAQCLRRSERGGRDLPTPELTRRVADACDAMAARFGVTSTELRAWIAALRRAGWSPAVVECSLLAAVAAVREVDRPTVTVTTPHEAEELEPTT